MTSSVTESLPPLAVKAMADRFTLPFARGADQFPLSLVAGVSPDTLIIDPYNFSEHVAQFGSPPEVSYVVSVRGPVTGIDQVVVDLSDPAFPGGIATSTVMVPPSAGPGDAFVVMLPTGVGPDTRMVALRITAGGIPVPTAPDSWAVTALLGTLARLLWVLGVERDRLSHARDGVRVQRVVEQATGAGLDLIGTDLQVPRFPPTPYSVDAATIALYHLDDQPGATPAVTDAAAAFPGRAPHHGTVSGGLTVGVQGRYDRGVGCGPAGTITIGTHADFDIAAGGSFTIDCFVRPDPATTVGTVASRLDGATGWSLEVGDVGLGVAGAVRGTISDGATALSLVAAVGLPTDRFSHVALVLSRDSARPEADRWTLMVNGVTVVSRSASGLGAVGGSAAVLIGPGATGFVGAVDEVRLSSMARTSFHPVLGEADEQYRRRLGLFRRWVLPTSAGLTAVLNALVPEIDGVAAPFVVTDVDGVTQGGSRLVRVWPTELVARQGIDAAGRVRVAGIDPWPAVQPFDAALLGRHNNPLISYAAVPSDPARSPMLAAPDPHLMQPAVATALDRLAVLLPTHGIGGTLVVTSGFDQAADDSRAAGRAVMMRLPGTTPGRFAALTHRAGFDYVERRLPDMVYAACSPGTPLLLGPPGSAAAAQAGSLPEVTVGTATTVTLAESTATYTAPLLPADATIRFWTIPTSAGRGDVSMAAATGLTATLHPTAPGVLGLSADIRRGHHVVTVTAAVVILPGPLADGASIAADGTLDVGIDVVGPAEADFAATYLVNHADPRIDYGADPDHHLMQCGTGRVLSGLTGLLADDGVAGQLQVLGAYDPAAAPADLASRGRLLVLDHTILGADELAVRAHRAGFGYVARSGATVKVACPAADLVGVDGPDEVEVGAAITLTAQPGPGMVSPTTRLGWSSGQVVSAADTGQGLALVTPGDPHVTAVGTAPGVAWVRATLRDATTVGPYAVTVRRRPELATAQIGRNDYYLVMNALNTLHPVGVEVLTDDIRAAVIELGSTPSGLDPAFTYPPFRLHRPVPITRNGKGGQ